MCVFTLFVPEQELQNFLLSKIILRLAAPDSELLSPLIFRNSPGPRDLFLFGVYHSKAQAVHQALVDFNRV